LWQREHRAKNSPAKDVPTRNRDLVLFSVFALFALALAVRIPSALWFNQPYEKTPLIYLLVLTILLVEKTDLSAFGFRTENLGKSLLQGLALFGVVGGVAAAFYYGLIYSVIGEMPIKGFNIVQCLLVLPFMTLCVGISEEGLFRGYMQTHLEKFHGREWAILFQAILFGFWHFVWNLKPFSLIGMSFYIVSTFFFGLLFGYVYSKTRNIVPVVLAHGLWNSIMPSIVETQKALDVSAPWLLPEIVTSIITVFVVHFLIKEPDSRNPSANG
jgi:membrane protease YdiL (CAAX protease family)